MRVEIEPRMLRWAQERSRIDPGRLAQRFPKLAAWERREVAPTFKQLEKFARATYTPIGYLFLEQPPTEVVPIPDFRTIAGTAVGHASPNLLDMLYVCQQRQEWYHDYARNLRDEPLAFVGSLNPSTEIVAAAEQIRDALEFDLDERRVSPTWTDALRRFIDQADQAGILVMASGVVLNNNRRPLDPNEFRGFAMADAYAPLVFINGADTKAAQMFTLAHEVAHIWLGQSALSDAQALIAPAHDVERWCNSVAAELLVPLSVFREEYRGGNLRSEMDRLARQFKVSTLVILRRVYDAGGLTFDELREAYQAELDRLLEIPRGSGGNFYLTQAARVSKRFARALVASTLEGQTLHRDAFRLLGFSKLATFQELGRSLGVGA